MTIKTKTACIAFFIFLALLIGTGLSHAAEVNISSLVDTLGVGQEMRVDIFLDTEGMLVNAVQGEIVFPSDLLGLSSVLTGQSIISLWVESPRENPTGRIRFAGAVPGGKKTDDGYLFSAVFVGKKEGPASLVTQDIQAIEHAAKPRLFRAPTARKVIDVVPESSAPQLALIHGDRTPPEAFTPTIARGVQLFNNRFFIIFNTSDLETGIDYYEMFETTQVRSEYQLKYDMTIDWIEVTNPAVLQDQTRSSYVYVKAIDHAGNATIAIVKPEQDLSTKGSYKYPDLLGILLVLVLALLLTRTLYLRRQRE